MKRLILALGLAGAATLLALGVASAAGTNPHGPYTSTADGCAGCHRTHTGTATNLLKSDQLALCGTCHGGTGADTNVNDGVFLGTGGGALRGGGFKNARINGAGGTGILPGAAATAGAAVTSAHDVNPTMPAILWGAGAVSATPASGTAWTLQCGDCHNPHGNGNYRLLRPDPQQRAGVAGVTVSDPGGIAYTTANYWDTYRTDPASGPTAVNMSSWCSQCHTRYLTSASTDSGDAIFKFRHKSNGADSYAAKAGSPYFSATANPSYKDSCLQCHVSHGSNVVMGANSQGVPNPGSSSGRGTDSSLLKIDNRGTCVACHGTTP